MLSHEPGPPTQTCPTGAFTLSAGTRPTSKKPDLWDVRPVSRKPEMEAEA